MSIRFLYFLVAFTCFSFGKALAQDSLLQQKFTIEVTNQPIKQVLELLEKQGGFAFGYSEKTIDVSKIVTIKLEDKPLKNILKTIFPLKKNQFKQVGDKILIYEQNRVVSKKGPNYTLSGYVKEKGSQEYLSRVSISISELQLGTITNEYGFFSLTIPEGSYELWVTYLGYEPLVEQIDLSKDLQQNFELLEAPESLDEVIINTSNETDESEVTQMGTATINPAEINDIPVILGEKDAIKTFQLLPGIASGNEGGAGFYVRGGTPDQNLILLDEAPVYNANHLFGIFSLFNGDAIQSAEVFKGGFPAKYGGRLSSVLRLDTKNGNKERFGGQYNIGLVSSSFLLEGPLQKNKTSFVLSGRRTYLDALIRPFLNKEDGTGAYLFSDLIFKIHHVIDEKNKLFWSNYFGEDKFFIRVKGSDADDSGKIRWGNITSTLRWNHEFNNTLFSNTSLIFSNYKFLAAYEDENNDINTNSGINDYGIKTDLNYYPNFNHDIRIGMATTYHDFIPNKSRFIQNNQTILNSAQRIRSLESAFYVEDDWSINTKFNVTAGLRLSHFLQSEKQYFRPEPRLSFSWKPGNNLAIKGAYAQMNQYVHLLSFAGVGLPIDLWVTSTSRIKPQYSEQVSVGLVKDLLNKNYTLSVEGYYKKMRDIISYREGANFVQLESNQDAFTSFSEFGWEQSITTGQGWAYGAEFLARKKTGKLRGWLGYTLSWAQRQFDQLNNGQKFSARYDRRHDLSFVTTYAPSKKITLSANWILSSGLNYTIQDKLTVSNYDNLFGDLNTNTPPSPIEYASERNNLKGATYHRLDLGIQFHKKKKKES